MSATNWNIPHPRKQSNHDRKIINKQAAKPVLEYFITLRLKGSPMLESCDAVDWCWLEFGEIDDFTGEIIF